MKSFITISLLFISFSIWANNPDEHPCGNFKSEIPQDWIQGTIKVQEDVFNKSGREIEVFYYGKLRSDRTPVVFFNGGPGQHSHDAFYIINRAQKVFDAGKDLSFIFIDQRGTGCSNFYPQGSSDETLGRLTNYGSRGIVEDAEAIRKTLLGDRPWIIFGQSYGAHIVHRYVTLYPKSVKAAFAHGNALNSTPFDRFKYRIASQIRVMDYYLKMFPEDEKLFKVLSDNLTTDVCFFYGVNRDKKACGWEVTEDLISSFLGSYTNWFKLHQWLNAMADEKGIDLKAVANYVEFSFVELSEKYSKKWADRVISWTDRNTAPYDRRHCSFVDYELSQDDISLSNNAFNECSSILQDLESGMDNWGRKMVKFLAQDILTIDHFTTALRRNPKLNFYLYSGQKDPFVPVETFQEELSKVKMMPNLFYKNFPNSGHEGYQTESLIWKQMIKEANN